MGRKSSRAFAARRPATNMPSSYSSISNPPRSLVRVTVDRAECCPGDEAVHEAADASGGGEEADVGAAERPPRVRSVMSRRRISRTRAIGLRRDPQPPMPIVIPLSMVATASSCSPACPTSPLLRVTGAKPSACLGITVACPGGRTARELRMTAQSMAEHVVVTGGASGDRRRRGGPAPRSRVPGHRLRPRAERTSRGGDADRGRP